MTAYDWTSHIPLIFRHPERIPAGRTSDALVSNYDFLPSLVHYLGLADQERSHTGYKTSLGRSPGRDFSAILRGELPRSWNDTVYFEFETVRSIRTRDAKLVVRHPEGPNELFDLRADPGEQQNLYDVAERAAGRDALRTKLDEFFAAYADPQYDLWRDGRSKAPLHHKRAAGK
jgi:arylsulfatase A-like enzyme